MATIPGKKPRRSKYVECYPLIKQDKNRNKTGVWNPDDVIHQFHFGDAPDSGLKLKLR